MKKRSGFTVMARLIGLVRPLAGYMVLAIGMGLVGHLCAAFITIFGGWAMLDLLGFETPVPLKAVFVCELAFALVRGVFRYAEQACNHFIAFKLLALLRDRVFRALRRLCPAKLEGRDKGDLISVITSDIELLEVFYAHTISPAVIAALFTVILCVFIGRFHWALGLLALAALGSTLQNTFAAGNRVLDILDETPAVAEVTGEAEIGFDGAAAENVTFSYGGETILDNVSVDIPAHAVVGIVGRSGSGKSTLLKLLMRFWDVREGHVRISGTDIARVNTANLRALEGFVTQETHLFQGTIRDNLRIARPDATDEEIAAACRKASVHAFIAALPQGYDTQVGELGDTLSGGERQRLGLARAFLHDAPFLLLDEPTSNLDSLNEAIILRSLYAERAGRTVVLVSHRASTMRIADTVYSVEHGRMS